MTTVIGSKIHQLYGCQYCDALSCTIAVPTYNKAGSLWIVCTTGCDIVPVVDEMRVSRRLVKLRC
jgi:hypothetical protein